MTTTLGDQAIVGRLLCDNIGLPAAHVNTIYVDNIIPTPITAPETLQATMTQGNTTTLPLKIASTVDMYNIADTTFATNICKLSTDPLLSNGGDLIVSTKESDPAVLEQHTIFRAVDKKIECQGNVDIKSVGDKVIIGKNTSVAPVYGAQSVNIGEDAGFAASVGNNQAVNIGAKAGQTNAGGNSVAIGVSAGANGSGSGSIAIGANAGNSAIEDNAVVIGSKAAPECGGNSVAIGALAGNSQMDKNCIVINATGLDVSTVINGTCKIDPIRIGQSKGGNTDELLHHNDVTKEVYVDRIRYTHKVVAVTNSATLQLTALDPSVFIIDWTSGSGLYEVLLPAANSVPRGTYYMIKNFSQTAGQSVVINRGGGTSDTIDKDGGTGCQLDSTPRNAAGGGGSCLEVMCVSDTEWCILRGFNQIFG